MIKLFLKGLYSIRYMSISDDAADAPAMTAIRRNLITLNERITNVRGEEMRLRVLNYNADSAPAAREGFDTKDKFSEWKKDKISSWRQRQIANGRIRGIEDLTKRVATEILTFVERNPNFNNRHFIDILQYLFGKMRAAEGGSYVWPIPLEHNISNFIEYIDSLKSPSSDAGKASSARLSRKSLRKRSLRHKKQKEKKKRRRTCMQRRCSTKKCKKKKKRKGK